MSQTLVVLAAGLSTRYGGNKQLASVGPSGEVLLDYAVYDAVRAGFTSVTFVVRRELVSDFQEHVARRFGGRVRVAYSYQELQDLPDGVELPSNRIKPWGTAHAILAVRDVVNEPFVVINADDFYGKSAYSSLYEFREQAQTGGIPEYAMIGYTLNDTLSVHGGVSRGICECNEADYLERLVEVKTIERTEREVSGVTTHGHRYPLQGHETVSMNIWALTPDVFPALQRQFAKFSREHGADQDAEFLISSALHDQIVSGISRLRVIPARDRWFGMTFKDDRPSVAREIGALVQGGVYPDNLTNWFQGKK